MHARNRTTRRAGLLAFVMVYGGAVSSAAPPSCPQATPAERLIVCIDEPGYTPKSRCDDDKRFTAKLVVSAFIGNLKYKIRYAVTAANANPVPEDWHDVPGPPGSSGEAFPFHQPRPKIDIEPSELTRNGPFRLSVQIESSQFTSKTARDELDIRPRVHAIVVGVSEYKYGISGLTHADDDARAFKRFLEAVYPDELLHVKLLVDKKAERDAITDELERLGTTLDSCGEDTVIFYFSGHGLVETRPRGFARVLGTYDTDPADLLGTALRHSNLLSSVKNIEAGSKLIINDSCFSGGSRTGSKMLLVTQGVVQEVESANIASEVRREDIHYFLRGTTSKQQGLYLSASMTDQPALEICLQPKRNGDPIHANIVFMGKGNKCETANGNRIDKGHGLYTYMLLNALESQMNREHRHGDISDDAHDGSSSNCLLDFEGAHASARGWINELDRTIPDRMLPKPDIIHTNLLDWEFQCKLNAPTTSQ